jgi:hypothetical protein
MVRNGNGHGRDGLVGNNFLLIKKINYYINRNSNNNKYIMIIN